MLLSMARVQVIGVKRCLPATVLILQRLGAVQIDQWRQARALTQRRMDYDEAAIHLRERLAYLATQVEAVLAALPPLELAFPSDYETCHEKSLDWLLDTIVADLSTLQPQVQALTAQRAQLQEQLGSLPRYEATLKQLLPLVPAVVELEQYTVTAIWLERRHKVALEVIAQQLHELTEGLCEVVSREIDHDILAAILVFPKTQAVAVNKLLGQENISQVRLPTEFAGQPLERALAEIRQRLQQIPHQLANIEDEQANLARQWRPRLLVWRALLRDHLAQIDVCANFGQTDYTFVIEGWIPKHRLAELESTLARQVGNEVIVTELPVGPDDRAQMPVVFDNPNFARPFEPLVGLLALPKQGSFDPTPLMAVFMPVFFGLILGDVAYGAILLLIMLAVRRRFKARAMLRSLAEALIIGSVWSIGFGFLFGEFFGDLGEMMGLHPLWFDRGRDVQSLLLLAVGIGAGHVVLGIGLGVWQAAQHRNRHLLVEKAAMLLSLAALFLLAATLAKYLPNSLLTPAIALLIVGLAMLIYSMGGLGLLLGPLELLGTVGNILSYLRIAAIGLSSVYLAQVANELAGVFGNLFVGLIIATLFHALNIALGAFSPTIQSLRLHYVEFFSKFYEGGGQPFQPFARSIDQ